MKKNKEEKQMIKQLAKVEKMVKGKLIDIIIIINNEY